MKKRVVIIGGGFFGLEIAAHCARKGCAVVLLEREQALMRRASYNNQARVHNGYHYPRSVLTALRSRVNYPIFRRDYADCIDATFQKLYAVPRQLSKVTAAQFRRFMERIGAPIASAPSAVSRLFTDRIESVFACEECAFDSERLMAISRSRALEAGVDIRLGVEARRVLGRSDRLEVETSLTDGAVDILSADLVFNCTYSRLNEVLRASALQPLNLKHEMTELCLVEPPPELRPYGVTVMCGPFFSIMPFPARGLYTLSHVRYTPHFSWLDNNASAPDPYRIAAEGMHTAFRAMVLDSRRYLPCVDACVHRGSLCEVKTVLPKSEGDDSRPILFQRSPDLPALLNIMGGKIDNIYDAIAEVDALLP